MRYTPDHAGIAALLVGDDMGRAMRAVAEAGRELAIANSPVGDDEDPGRPRYVESFEVAVEVQDGRQTAILANTAGHAFAVELRDRVLSRVSDWMEAGP